MSTSVLNIAGDVADVTSFWGIFGIEVSSPSIAKSGFINLAKIIGFSVDNVDELRQLISNFKRGWLLILDNGGDPESDYQVYHPSGGWGTIIMTSLISRCRQYQTIGSETITGLEMKEHAELLL